MKKWLLYLLVVLVVLGFVFFFLMRYLSRVPEVTTTPLKSKFEEISSDIAIMDLYFPKDGLCDEVSEYWKSNGICSNEEFDGEKGVIILHPLTLKDPGFIFKTFKLPSDATTLYVKLANFGAKLERWGMPLVYGDNIFRIILYDMDNFDYCVEDEFVVHAIEGWVEKTYDISDCSGNNVVLYIFNYAGGEEKWSGEWGGIGKIEFK